MTTYYNEFEPFAAEWLRNLISAGLIAPGDVDERSITEVQPDDLIGYTQCHFFAGIGGWSAALRLAGWPDDRPVWTGSPPCQPFSVAGAGAGVEDERHLAPHFLELVAAVRPPVIFGEQVAAAVKKDNWLDDLLDELEDQGYATGAVVSPACGVGAGHIRQRVWFTGRLADADKTGLGIIGRGEVHSGRPEGSHADDSDQTGGLANSQGGRQSIVRGEMVERDIRHADRSSNTSGRVGDAKGDEQRRPSKPAVHRERGKIRGSGGDSKPSPDNSQWANPDWLFCRDGKWRPVEPGTFPLAHGVPGRVGRLRAYGNAIVPHVAAEVIRTLMECRP